MKNIVITGSTRGIGYGLADSFLALGCSVVVSGRTQEGVEAAVSSLATRHDAGRIVGQPCDVTRFDQVQALWDVAQARFGGIDMWVNNAGIGHAQMHFWEHSPEEIAAVIETNIVGTMYGSKVALQGMLAQGWGSIYILEGLGSGGRRVEGLTLYGSTKHGLKYLADALAEEVKGTPVIVGALRPGMVVTDMLTGQYEGRPEDWERAKRVFSILADRVETVTPWFAKKMLANTKNGARFKWLNTGRLVGHLIAAGLGRRNLFD
jgi:NAD(P)-dependent dehydrogenase (short-subunit alcohol dehydrogenase family)